ncbi:uncharacterized protein [Nicotiana sylvestris]|uniref:uncharacterized protein n=1 Tax=Nicotiana sylvestris TaxID=4096 RepID=UPI00388C9968
MENIFKIKQGDSELLREFVDRFQREIMMLPRVPDNWAAIAFTSNLNEKSLEATRRLKESLREFPATTWNDVYNSEKGKQAYMKNRKEPPKPPSPKRTVNVISRGEDINGVTYTAANKISKVTITQGKRVRHFLEEESITFDDADADGVLSPHNDALDHLEWNEECQYALKNLKTYLSNPPLLAKPKAGERLLIYLAVLEVASVVLVREDQVTAYPLRNILHKYELSGRLDKGAIELSEYDVTYQPRTAIKSQVLADFVADFSQGMQLEAEKELRVLNGSNPGIWTLFTDGSSNVKGAGLGIVLVPPTGEIIRQAIKCHSITNNEAEYEAVIAGLELARELGLNQIVIKSDSQLALANLASVYGTVPEDKKKAHVLRKKVARYCLKQYNLYRKMFGGPLARCLGPSQTEYIMREMHEGHCGNYSGGRSLVKTIIRAGYYSPKMEEEAGISWLNMINAKGTIKRITSTPYHPVGNGQADSTNKVIINNLKKCLEESKGNWPEVLPGVLWAYRTTAKTSPGETPFSLVYGAEALIPVEVGEPSTRFTQASEESNDEEICISLDLHEGRREVALIRMAAQKQVIKRYYNRKAHLRFFMIGDFVLKKFFNLQRQPMQGN